MPLSPDVQGMVMLILATDMARHSEILETFKAKVDKFDFASEDHLNSVSRTGSTRLQCQLKWSVSKTISCEMFANKIFNDPFSQGVSWKRRQAGKEEFRLCQYILYVYVYVWISIFSERERKFTFAKNRYSDVHVHVRYLLSPVRLSVVCLSSVTLVRPSQAVQIFGNISTALGTVAIRWHPLKILRRSSQGNPSAVGVKHKRDSKVYRFWNYRRLYLGNGAL